MDNTSGQGKGAVMPEEAKGLAWGAFFWQWIWGIFNRVWLSFLVFVPVIGLAVPFVLLFKGRQWAWQSKTWESVEEFNRVQRKWAIAGLIFLAVAVLAIVAAIAFVGFAGDSAPPPKPAVASAPVAKPAPPKPAPQPAAQPAAPAPAPVVAEPAKPEPVAAAPAVAAPATPAKDRPKRAPRRAAPAQAELLSGPAPSAPPPEPRVYTPQYNDLMTAVLRPDPAGVMELLALGRWVDKADDSGATPLIAAVRLRDLRMAELLLSRGANPNAFTKGGSTPLSIARLNGDSAMTALLQRNGAR